MKKVKNIFTLFLTVLLAVNAFAQDRFETPLVSRDKPGISWYYSGLKPYNETKLRKYDRLIVDIVYNDWHGDADFFDSPWSSIGFNAQLMFDKVITKENTFAIGWGLGFSHMNNKTPWLYQKNYSEEMTSVVEASEVIENLSSAKFCANYLELPIELRFRTKGYKHVKFMVGGKIGYQLTAYNKIVERIDGRNYAFKTYNFPDNNPLRLGATVRIGIRNWALFGAYHFTKVFTNSQSIQLTPYSVGISISLF